jgi:predicted secreted protein
MRYTCAAIALLAITAFLPAVAQDDIGRVEFGISENGKRVMLANAE